MPTKDSFCNIAKELEVAQENAEQAGARLAELMTNIKPNEQALSVPLLVEWASGKNWNQAH